MDGIDTLQSSTPETKAERIARYKAERRRELAERYGNTEEFTSKYVRRDRKIGETSETASSGTKEREKHEDNGSEPTYSRRGMRTKVADSGDEATHEFDANTDLKTETESEVVSSVKASSSFSLHPTPPVTSSLPPCFSFPRQLPSPSIFNGHYLEMNCSLQMRPRERWYITASVQLKQAHVLMCRMHIKLLETDDPEEPKPEKASDSAGKMSYFKKAEGKVGGSSTQRCDDSTKQQLISSDREETSTSEGMSTGMPSRQTSVTLSHPESEEEGEEEEEDEDNEVEKEDDVEEEVSRESYKEDDSPTDDIPDGGCFSVHREEKNSGGSTSSRESFEEMQSPSPDESLETTSTVSEDVDELESSLDQSQGSALKHRLAALSGEDGEKKDGTRKSKPSQVVQTSLADRFNQLHGAENAWMKKVSKQHGKGCSVAVNEGLPFSSCPLWLLSTPTDSTPFFDFDSCLSAFPHFFREVRAKKSNVDLEPKMSLAERMKILRDKEEQWKSKGKGAANDSVQFTVAGRMAKKGLVSKDEPPIITLKKSNATPVKPHEEISSRTDVKVEGDKRLDKLESFLDKLHNKGVGKAKSSTIEVTEEMEKEVMTLDDDETFGNFYKPVSPSTLLESSVVLTEEDLSDIQADTPKLTSAVAEHKRAVRPARRNQGSRNPLRALAARNDIRQVYTEQRLNVASVETKRIQVERMAKHSNLADVALAGLASKENFRKVNLRSVKSTEVVTNNSAVPFHKLMLIRIKGRRHIQVRLVEPTARSLNSGDCFLLITPKHCFMWSGEFANVIEKAKASEMASFVQAKRDLGCKAPQVSILEEGINTESRWAKEFWSLIGGKTKYRGAGEPEEDELYESGVVDSNGVYRLQGDKLVPHEDAWASIPSVSLLDSKEVTEVYVWHGKDVPLGDRKVAVKLGKQLYSGSYDYSSCRVNPLDSSCNNTDVPQKGEGRPSWTLFGRLSEHNETSLFREKFLDWAERKKEEAAQTEEVKSPEHSTLRSPLDLELQPCDAKALLDNEADPVRTLLEGVDVQRGYGLVKTEDGRQAELATVAVEAWHIKEHGEEELPEESVGQLHEGDAYIIRWKYSITTLVGKRQKPGELSTAAPGRERTACFFWQGRHSSASEKGTSALMTVELGSHRGSQVLVTQGKEPPCFLQLFQGGLIVHKGSRDDTSSSSGGWRLFCVRGEAEVEASLVQVACERASLRSRASLVLLNAQKALLYLWHGCKAQADAKQVAKRAADKLKQRCPSELGLNSSSKLKVEEVEEGSEPAEVLDALGPQDKKAYDCMLEDPGKYNYTPRLFRLSASSGMFGWEEQLYPARVTEGVMAMPFLQESLYSAQQPALFLLDNRMEVYLWQGWQPDDTQSTGSAKMRWDSERKCAMETVLQYCKEKNPRRPPRAYLVLAGLEPLTFTNIFPYWEKNTSITSKVTSKYFLLLLIIILLCK
ncbi:hypothetical protein CCH79_00003016 [Gambusia affinis]|uniref:Gelsolin-like domain-containing protein n=1 Tax=Gambusia affinis TaxID=33528 RepID=A0A315VEG5_GAMAF|nr:hypothetical protein CCH79_00003016 [Gambusia affinis]